MKKALKPCRPYPRPIFGTIEQQIPKIENQLFFLEKGENEKGFSLCKNGTVDSF